MSATPLGEGSARATLLEALDAYLDAVKAAAAHVIESQPPPEAGEVRSLSVIALLQASTGATELASVLLQGVPAVPAQALLAPAVEAAIAGALTVSAKDAREWAQRTRAESAGLTLPGAG